MNDNLEHLGERKKVKNIFEEFNIGIFLYSVKNSLIWALMFLIVSIAISLFYLRHTPDIFESHVTLMRKVTKQTQILGIQELLAEDKTEIDIEIQLLKSKLLISKAIDTLPLTTEYYIKGTLSKTLLYKTNPFTVDFKKDGEELSNIRANFIFSSKKNYKISLNINGEDVEYDGLVGKKLTTPFFELDVKGGSKEIVLNQQYEVVLRDFNSAVEQIVSKITITPLNVHSNTLKISMENTNPRKAYDIVHNLAHYFIEFDKVKKGESIDNTIAFLTEQIFNFGNQYYDAQDSLKQFKFETGFIEPTTLIQKNINKISELDKELVQNDLSNNSLNWLEDYLKSDMDLTNLTGMVLTDQSASFESSITNIVSLQSKRNQKLLNVTPDHPDILLLNKEISLIKSNLLTQLDLAKDKNSLKKDLIKKEVTKLYTELYSLPDKEADYTKILRENNLKEQFYLNLVEKKNLYLISKAGIVSDYIILQSASVPKKPIAPDKTFIRLIGVVVGLMLGVFFIILKYFFYQKVTSLNELTSSTNANILGLIPKHKDVMERSAVVVTENPKSSISEAFRAIRANLEFLDSNPGSKIITTTSTIPGEGKTFVGINLAAIFSLLDKKVIILDFDLRKPRIAKIFEVDTQAGISTVLIGRSPIEDCIYNSGIKNLDFIPSGPVPPNPSELIMKQETREMIAYLQTKYDYVFIDTPPIGLVTDSLELLKLADYPIYVVRADYSERAFLDNINKLIFDNKIANLSVVLNDFGRGASSNAYSYGQSYGQGYGYGYGYGNGMGYYSEENVKEKSFLRKFFSKIFKFIFK